MKLLTHKFLLVIFYLLSTVISYSTEQPNFKNLIVYSEAKKLKNIEFKNNFNEIIKLNDKNVTNIRNSIGKAYPALFMIVRETINTSG